MGQETTPERPRRGRWRRFGLRALALLVALALLLPATVLLGLRIGAVRQLVLGRVAGLVEERSGIRLKARDFRLGLSSGVVEIEELELSASKADESSPFLIVPKARAVLRWRTLLGEVPVIESLRVENPRLDLRAPLPLLTKVSRKAAGAMAPRPSSLSTSSSSSLPAVRSSLPRPRR